MSTTDVSPLPAGEDRYTLLHGLGYHYRDVGERDAPAVVLLHGLMGHCREWDILTAALARRFRVLVPDQRGHGRSDRTAAYSAAAMAGDVVELAERAEVPRLHLVGHSMGAVIAALVAADHADLVDRLVLLDVGPDSFASPWARRAFPAMLRALREASYADADEAVRDWLVGDPLAREALVRNVVVPNLVPRSDGRLVWRFDASGLVRFGTEGVTEPRMWRAIERIAAPTLVVRGRYSELLAPATAARMLDRLPHGSLAEIPDAAHDLGVQQPEAVAAAVLPFLTR
ncbi:alpha/beta fold hydrolase [Streptomyces sp. TR06-5]|uniref:alpha/beta fold hydrolase n=1 Tax=unclassified Streptomyces TaxID=2593676 RepID=UPI0039A156BC